MTLLLLRFFALWLSLRKKDNIARPEAPTSIAFLAYFSNPLCANQFAVSIEFQLRMDFAWKLFSQSISAVFATVDTPDTENGFPASSDTRVAILKPTRPRTPHVLCSVYPRISCRKSIKWSGGRSWENNIHSGKHAHMSVKQLRFMILIRKY